MYATKAATATKAVVKTNNPDGLDREFYIKAYKDVKPRFMDPYLHYYSVGQKEERLPNATTFKQLYPKFNFEAYRSHNNDLRNFTQEELMCHFHHYGRFEGRIYK
jgi:hypothetical protein